MLDSIQPDNVFPIRNLGNSQVIEPALPRGGIQQELRPFPFVGDSIPESRFRSHVVVKFREPFDPRYEHPFEVEQFIPQWKEWNGSPEYGEMELKPLFTAITPVQISELVTDALQRDKEYKDPNFFRYFALFVKNDKIAHRLEVELNKLEQTIERAYVGVRYTDPAINVTDADPDPKQIYLEPAPDGINAKDAWERGADGKGEEFLDFESGWIFGHPDLNLPATTLVGPNPNFLAQSAHGTAVLGVIRGLDNNFGITGIAAELELTSVKTASYWFDEAPVNGLVGANNALSCGGVLLIEAQLLDTWEPIELLEAEWIWIRNATARGITVVAAVGNAGRDFDTYSTSDAIRVNRTMNGFQDSGSIMVGAASKSNPPIVLASISNHGERVDCYALGEKVTTTGINAAGQLDIIHNFDATSSAAAIVAGAALLVQHHFRNLTGKRLRPNKMRSLLSSFGTQVQNAAGQGRVIPDLKSILDELDQRKNSIPASDCC